MNGFIRLLLIVCMSLNFISCVTSPDDESGTDVEAEDTIAESDPGSDSEDFDELDAEPAATAANEANTEESLENELDQVEGYETAEKSAPAEQNTPPPAPTPSESLDEFSDFETQASSNDLGDQSVASSESAPPPPEINAQIEEAPAEEMPPPMVDTAETVAPSIAEGSPEEAPKTAKIKNIKYKANDNGGTLVIEADEPLDFETRKNEDTNQFIVEIPNAELPSKLKRPFNTKDMKGGIGSVDAYQNKGSTTARIVIQLRPGTPEPTVQPEGKSLLVVQSGGAETSREKTDLVGESTGEPSDSVPGDEPQSEILSSASLQEFMSGNTQFYGKKISLEVSEMDVKEVFKLISEESGINLVLSDDVKGTVSLKLRQVPWDQALVVIMKARKLGYTRAGNVLRIAPLADIKAEEDDSLKLQAARKAQVALKVRMLPVSYAKIDELINQIKPFLSERGKAVGDARTSAIVVSDLDENLERVAKLVSSIDIPPPQVLIEGKVVEATDQFQRQLGINWSASGQPGILGRSSNKPIRAQSSISISPGSGAATGALTFSLGTLDILGDLTATLSLFEQQSAVKVLSSPRIVTLHNEPAEITQTTDIPLLKETIANGTTTRSVDFKSVKLKLGVTPQITNDASVIMTVDVNRDFLGGVEEQTTQSRAINTRTAKTKVMVRNGQTAVIGGIYQSDQNQSEARVPWAADIPVLGWLFKNRNSFQTKNELLIFLTPRILGQADTQSIRPRESGEIE